MKILGIIIVMALLLGGAVVSVAATPEITVSIDAPAQAASDSDFTANVNISQVTNFDACNYDVSFDATVLRFGSVTSGLIGSTTIPVDIYNQISSGRWRIVQNVPGIAGVGGSGYLAVLHFHVIGSGGQVSQISLSNGVLSDIAASEIKATWAGGSMKVAAAPEATTPPTAVTPSPEGTTPQTVVSPSPEATAPNKTAPLPTKSINWPVLLGIVGGMSVVGLIIILLARRRAY